MTEPEVTTEAIQWGVLIVLPIGASDVEIAFDRAGAIAMVERTNTMVGPDTARLVYRTATYGPWREDATGDEWGVQITWPADNYAEVDPADSRAAAERSVRLHQGTSSIAQAVSRPVAYSDWWLADASTAPHPAA